MSAVDAYLAELRIALGDRLPPSVKTARLRETRSHLLASVEDVGEAEAIRRYGRPRIVANALVRAQRGYGERHGLKLACPIGAAWCVYALAVSALLAACRGEEIGISAFRLMGPLGALASAAFFVRAVQTRRWLVVPMVGWQIAGTTVMTVVAWLTMPLGFGQVGPATFLWRILLALFISKAVLNALALGVGRLLELRPVRRAR